MYDLHHKVSQLKQGDQSLALYYSIIRSLYEESDFYKIFKAQYIEDAILYN